MAEEQQSLSREDMSAEPSANEDLSSEALANERSSFPALAKEDSSFEALAEEDHPPLIGGRKATSAVAQRRASPRTMARSTAAWTPGPARASQSQALA